MYFGLIDYSLLWKKCLTVISHWSQVPAEKCCVRLVAGVLNRAIRRRKGALGYNLRGEKILGFVQ